MPIFADNFCYTTFVNPINNAKPKVGLTIKNWIKVFNEMTTEEWQEVSNGELEGIFDEIQISIEQ